MTSVTLRIVFCVFLTLGLFACRQEPPTVSSGIVEPNKYYQQYFGDPPEVREGKAYARVAFLPMKEDANRVSAVPIYLFKESGQLESILNRLVSGELLLPKGSPMFNPFSSRINMSVKSYHEGTATLLLELPKDSSIEPDMFLPAIVETAAQFADIKRVIVLVDNEPFSGMPDGGYQSIPQRISDVAPPGLIMIAGVWDEGTKDPEEITVNFDRPVTVNKFLLSHADGQKITGEFFSSVFQMAIIIHPENPARFREGIELIANWEIADAKGRAGTGRSTFALQRFEHKIELKAFQK